MPTWPALESPEQVVPVLHAAACSEKSIGDMSLSRHGQLGLARWEGGCPKDQATPPASKLTTVF